MSEGRAVPLQEAEATAARVLKALEDLTQRAQVAGSIRRRRPHVKDIEIVAEPATVPSGLFGEPELAIEEIRALCESIGRVTKGGTRYIQTANVYASGLTLDLFLVHPPSEWGPQLVIRTGPAHFSERVVTRIKGRMWRCQAGHVTDERGRVVPCPTEEDFFAAAQMEYAHPERRDQI